MATVTAPERTSTAHHDKHAVLTMIQSLIDMIVSLVMGLIVGHSIKVHISGIEIELPSDAEKAEKSGTSATVKAVSKASRSYVFDNRITSIRSMQDWFDRCSDVSYYFVLNAGVTLHVGKATLEALDHQVQIILTKVNDSMLVYIIPEKDDAGRLLVTNTKGKKHKIRYNAGDDKTAGYIECKGLTVTPKYTGEASETCYGRGVICPKS